MSKSINKKKDHCCKAMAFFLDEEKVAVFYNDIYREYYLGRSSFTDIRHVIYYCPWCNNKLPISLRKVYFDVLYDDYKIFYFPPTEECSKVVSEKEYEEVGCVLPKEFKTDEWWKKRGL